MPPPSSLASSSLRKVSSLLSSQALSPPDLLSFCYSRAILGEETLALNNFAHLNSMDDLLPLAAESQRRYELSEPLSALDGVPVAIKANFCRANSLTTSASSMLSNYRPPFTATAVSRLEAAGAIIMGSTNMDEFGMGSLTSSSVHGPSVSSLPYLPHLSPAPPSAPPSVPRLSPGGSSGGSASSVALRSSFLSLGTDTGGSVRLPAAFCGVAGFKPGYGEISRFGVIQYASSLDTVGVFTPEAGDARLAYEVLRGGCKNDETSSLFPSSPLPPPAPSLSSVKIGIPLAYSIDECLPAVKASWASAASSLEAAGASLVHLGDDRMSEHAVQQSLAAYYVVACAEAASNLSKYDGVRFGSRERDPEASFFEEIENTRAKHFGKAVRERIATGNEVLSKEGSHYQNANGVRGDVRDAFTRCFEVADVLVMPAQVGLPPEVGKGEEVSVGLANDLMTCGVSLAGMPAIVVPVKGGQGIGVQLVANVGNEGLLLDVATKLEELDF